MPDVEGDKPARKKFKLYPIGYFHIDIAEVRTAEGKLYLTVAIDQTSKFAFVRVPKKTSRVTASAFLQALIEAVPYKIHIVLTEFGGPANDPGDHLPEQTASSSPSRHAMPMGQALDT